MVQWLRLHASHTGGPDLIPGQGTRSHMPQLRVHMPPLKIPHSTTKTWRSQMNKLKKISSVLRTTQMVGLNLRLQPQPKFFLFISHPAIGVSQEF